MKIALLCASGLLVVGTAQAQPLKLTPGADMRLRYEHVDQDGLPKEADAVTLRVRPGLTADWRNWSLLVEAEGVIAFDKGYNDGTNGKAAYPLIVDPENLELNRIQLRYASKGTIITAGRQRLNLADDRFAGTAPWRQSEQTYDAVRLQWGKPLGLSADVTYSWDVRTVNGRYGGGARPQSIGGNNVFALISYGIKPGTLSAFAYLVDQDMAAVQGFRLSSQTYGLRFAGKAPIAKDLSLAYVASWARQSDWHRNPNHYAADYWLGEISLAGKALSLTGGYEVLGADRGVALTSVQTPLASHFKFNGWAGKFTVTPPDGLRDLYGTAGLGWRKVGSLDAVNLGASWHHFTSDRMHRAYGDELDLLAGMKYGHYALSARYAHYRADGFATDTDKGWLQFDWTL
ncbi:alginate export family protein [Sphingobium sp. BYY-5]|uniref:alginate export family protein n=1 Tax=Sphingobium sp. BYY-5 TaxID=2926400 RepID=UPI001FA7BC08|nr:alginate export family protein [Sphingobium sp. BYY-5]MCI4588945.1 alginate export family protein [Sphingobium sp. BYY-5]